MAFSVLFLIGAMFCNDRVSAKLGGALSGALDGKSDANWEKGFKLWSAAKYGCWIGAGLSAFFP